MSRSIAADISALSRMCTMCQQRLIRVICYPNLHFLILLRLKPIIPLGDHIAWCWCHDINITFIEQRDGYKSEYEIVSPLPASHADKPRTVYGTMDSRKQNRTFYHLAQMSLRVCRFGDGLDQIDALPSKPPGVVVLARIYFFLFSRLAGV